jgi:hypothetical protein
LSTAFSRFPFLSPLRRALLVLVFADGFAGLAAFFSTAGVGGGVGAGEGAGAGAVTTGAATGVGARAAEAAGAPNLVLVSLVSNGRLAAALVFAPAILASTQRTLSVWH